MGTVALRYAVTGVEDATRKQKEFADTTEKGWGLVKASVLATGTSYLAFRNIDLVKKVISETDSFTGLSKAVLAVNSRITGIISPFKNLVSKLALVVSGITLAAQTLGKFDNMAAQLASKGLNLANLALGVMLGLWGKIASAAGNYISGAGHKYLEYTMMLVEANIEASNSMTGLISVARAKAVSIDEATEAAQRLAGDGLMTLTDSANSLKNLLAAGLSLPQAVEMMNAFKDAAAYGRQGALSLGEAVKGATQGFKNHLSSLIDNSGITKNLSDMQKEYAASIGKTIGQLTQEEKIHANYVGILKEALIYQGNAKLSTEGLSGAMALLNAQNQTLNQTMGKGAGEVLLVVVSRWANFKKTLNEMNPVMLETVGATAALWGGFLQVAGPILSVIGKLAMLAGALKLTNTIIMAGMIPGVTSLTGLFGRLAGVGWAIIIWGLKSITSGVMGLTVVTKLPLILLITALVSVVVNLAEKYKVLEWVSRNWNSFLKEHEGEVTKLVSAFKELVEWGKFLAEKVFLALTLAVEAWILVFANRFIYMLSIVRGFITSMEQIPGLLKKFVGLGKEAPGWILDMFIPVLGVLREFITLMERIPGIGKMFTGLGKKVDALILKIKAGNQEVEKDTGAAITSLTDTNSAWGKTVDALILKIKEGSNEVKKGIGQTIISLMSTKNAWAAVSEEVKKNTENTKNNTDDTIALTAKQIEAVQKYAEEGRKASETVGLAQMSQIRGTLVEQIKARNLDINLFKSYEKSIGSIVTEIAENRIKKEKDVSSKLLKEVKGDVAAREKILNSLAQKIGKIESDKFNFIKKSTGEINSLLQENSDKEVEFLTLRAQGYAGFMQEKMETHKETLGEITSLEDEMRETILQNSLTAAQKEILQLDRRRQEYGRLVKDKSLMDAWYASEHAETMKKVAKIEKKDHGEKLQRAQMETDIKTKLAEGLATALKSLWEGSNKTFDDVWQEALGVFINVMAQMLIQATITATTIAIEMAVASAGITLLIGLLILAFSSAGGTGTGKKIKTLSEGMEEVFDDFLDKFNNALDDFIYKIASASGRLDILAGKSEEVIPNIQAARRMLYAIETLPDVQYELMIKHNNGRSNVEAGVTVAVKNLMEDNTDLTKEQFDQVYGLTLRESADLTIRQYQIIADNAIELKEISVKRYDEEKKAIEEIGDEIADLYARQGDWIKGINESIVDVSRAAFTKDELLYASRDDAAKINEQLVGATGEEKIGLLDELKDKQLEIFRMTEQLYGTGTEQGVTNLKEEIKREKESLNRLKGEGGVNSGTVLGLERAIDALQKGLVERGFSEATVKGVSELENSIATLDETIASDSKTRGQLTADITAASEDVLKREDEVNREHTSNISELEQDIKDREKWLDESGYRQERDDELKGLKDSLRDLKSLKPGENDWELKNLVEVLSGLEKEQTELRLKGAVDETAKTELRTELESKEIVVERILALKNRLAVGKDVQSAQSEGDGRLAELTLELNAQTEFLKEQANTLAVLERVRDEGASEFDQLIEVQRDQLSELTGIRYALTAMGELEVRQQALLTAVKAIGTGDRSKETMDALIEYVGFISTHNLPSHKTGLDYVPYDGYTAKLHEGEEVVSVSERKRRAQAGQGSSKKTDELLEKILVKLEEAGAPEIAITIPVNVAGTDLDDIIYERTSAGDMKIHPRGIYDRNHV